MLQKTQNIIKKTSKKTITNAKAKEAIKVEACHNIAPTVFPSHSKEKKRLSRIKGQLDGVDRMIDEGRYCLDIIYQIRAASSALKALEKEIMVTHIKSCVKNAIESKDPYAAQEKIQEIMDFI